MLYIGNIAVMALAMAAAAKEDELKFWKEIRDLSTEEQSRRAKAREEIKEKFRKEATEERRHQELCAAIRARRC